MNTSFYTRNLLIWTCLIIIGGCGGKNNFEIFMQPQYNELKWKQSEFTVKTGVQVRVVMDNIATGMPMVLLTRCSSPAEIDAAVAEVGKASAEAGEAKQFYPENHPKIMLRTPLAAPGQKTEIVFTAPEPGDYPYLCTFSGHWQSMRGVMHVTP
jgi:uncharacterized cupredoxin-like copper-binding protein